MKRRIVYLIKIILFIVVFFLIKKGFEFILVDDDTSQRVIMHRLYTDDTNYDTIILGSSHGYAGFDADYMSKELGITALNLSTPEQNLDGSLALLKEADKYNDVKHVYLELYHWIGQLPAYDDRTVLVYQYNISDYMKPSINKYDYMLHMCNKNYYSTAFLPARRYWRDLFNPEILEENVKGKLDSDYKNYHEEDLDFGLLGPSSATAPDDMELEYTEFNRINRANFSEDWINSLKEIKTYCEDNGIELTVVVLPITDLTMVGVENYDEYIDFVKEIIGPNVKYYDFNLLKEEYFTADCENFSDNNHLNVKGRKAIMELLVALEKEDQTAKNLFYNSYSEKLTSLREELFWVYARPIEGVDDNVKRGSYGYYGLDEDGDGFIKYKIEPISTLKKADYSYTVIRNSNNEDTNKSQEYQMQNDDINDIIYIPVGEHGRLDLTVYATKSDKVVMKKTVSQVY